MYTSFNNKPIHCHTSPDCNICDEKISDSSDYVLFPINITFSDDSFDKSIDTSRGNIEEKMSHVLKMSPHHQHLWINTVIDDVHPSKLNISSPTNTPNSSSSMSPMSHIEQHFPRHRRLAISGTIFDDDTEENLEMKLFACSSHNDTFSFPMHDFTYSSPSASKCQNFLGWCFKCNKFDCDC